MECAVHNMIEIFMDGEKGMYAFSIPIGSQFDECLTKLNELETYLKQQREAQKKEKENVKTKSNKSRSRKRKK